MTLSKLNVFASKMPESGKYSLTDGTNSVPVRYKKGTGDVLVVIFHGAMDRATRTIPRFQSFIPETGSAHQLSIADETLSVSDDLAAAWYAGSEDFAFQSILPDLLKAFAKRIGTPRRIYVGGSSGGYAALYYSWADENSLCVAVNPQTKIEDYIPRVKKKYFDRAWPNATSLDEIKQQCEIDLSTLYAKSFDNTVIYVQSTGDMRHFSSQMPPFLTAALQKPEKFILQCSYWGIPNHSLSVPPAFYYNWVKAAILSPTWDRQKLLDTYYTLTTQSQPAAASQPAGKPKPAHSYDPQDIERANFLRDQQLQS